MVFYKSAAFRIIGLPGPCTYGEGLLTLRWTWLTVRSAILTTCNGTYLHSKTMHGNWREHRRIEERECQDICERSQNFRIRNSWELTTVVSLAQTASKCQVPPRMCLVTNKLVSCGGLARFVSCQGLLEGFGISQMGERIFRNRVDLTRHPHFMPHGYLVTQTMSTQKCSRLSLAIQFCWTCTT